MGKSNKNQAKYLSEQKAKRYAELVASFSEDEKALASAVSKSLNFDDPNTQSSVVEYFAAATAANDDTRAEKAAACLLHCIGSDPAHAPNVSKKDGVSQLSLKARCFISHAVLQSPEISENFRYFLKSIVLGPELEAQQAFEAFETQLRADMKKYKTTI